LAYKKKPATRASVNFGNTIGEQLIVIAGIGRQQRRHQRAAVDFDYRKVHEPAAPSADTITGLMLQWQDGKQVTLWPAKVANGTLKFPKFVKVGSAN
jgi:hypothetical protein